MCFVLKGPSKYFIFFYSYLRRFVDQKLLEIVNLIRSVDQMPPLGPLTGSDMTKYSMCNRVVIFLL